MGSIVEIDIGASKLVSISPHQLGVVTCCLAKPAISSFRFRQEYDLLVFETSTEKREKHSFEKELTQID